MKVNDHVAAESPARRTRAGGTAGTGALRIGGARKLFADKGFAEVSTQAIVTAAGVTRGALYHQFEDKAALFAAVYEEVERDLVAAIARQIMYDQPPDPLEAMRLGARLFLDRCSAPDVQRIVLIDAPAVVGRDRWPAGRGKDGVREIAGMLAHAHYYGA